MTTSDVLTLAKAHPETVAALLGAAASAVQADPALIPDVVTAVETKNYTGLALKHLGVLLQLVGIIGGNADLVGKLGQLAH